MKRLILTIFYIAISYAVFAQPAPKVDSTNLETPRKISKSDLKPIDGTNMIPAEDIDANIRNSTSLNRFYNALKIVGLAETFRSKGPVTVFVPDDEAMAKLSPGKIDTLLQTQHKYELIALITYHAIPGKIKGSNIVKQIKAGKGKATLTTLSGSVLTAQLDENRNIVLIDENGGKSTIKRFDLEQNNGLIHIVNSVLVPKFKII